MKTVIARFTNLFFFVASIVIVVGGAFIIYSFSKGYRLNILEKEILKTGVLTVKTEPSNANLYINGDEIGRTPRSRTLTLGTHTISVWKEGYREWKKDVEILAEKSTPVYPFLILEEIAGSNLWKMEGTLLKSWTNEYEDIFIYLIENQDKTYSLWSYRINAPLWYLNANPVEVLKLEDKDIEVALSPNGTLALIEKDDSRYLIDPSKTTTLEEIDQLAVSDLKGYEISWALDNKYLIFESADDIISVDTTRDTRNLLQKKNSQQEYVWTTDSEGFFYTVVDIESDLENIYTYAIEQIRLDGSDPKFTIEKIYLQKNTEYLEHYRNNGDTYPEFTSSPESTQAMGQIISIYVNQGSQGVYIKTDVSSYWYNIETETYRMITPYSADLLKFSPDGMKLLFANGGNIHTYTIDKEDGDHTETIGTKQIDGLLRKDIPYINWLPNSSYIIYTKDNSINISEKDGENTQELLDTVNFSLYAITRSAEYITTLEEIDNTIQINQYRIN